MESLLQLHRDTIIRLRGDRAGVKLTELLDGIVSYLDQNTREPTVCLRALTVICCDFVGVRVLVPFGDANVREHGFFHLLSRTLSMLLTKVIATHLTSEEEQCLDAISVFAVNLCLFQNTTLPCFYTGFNEQFNPNSFMPCNPMSYERIFFPDKFVSKFVQLIEKDLCKNEYSAYHIKYKLADRLLRLWMNLQTTPHKPILDAVCQCLLSPMYLRVYEGVDLRNPMLSAQQSLFLYQCPKFVRLMSGSRQAEISRDLCEKILRDANEILRKYLPIVWELESIALPTEREIKVIGATDRKRFQYPTSPDEPGAKISVLAWSIELLNYFALTPTVFIRGCFMTSYGYHSSMVDQMLSLVSNNYLIESVQEHYHPFHVDVALVSYALVLLYNLIFDWKIHQYLKSKRPFDVLSRLYSAQDSTIQFSSRTIAAILNREKIDRIDDPGAIARSYLYMIEVTLEQISLIFHGIELKGVLTNLETLVQNDEVKEEIVNVDGDILLADVATRLDLPYEPVRLPAVRILEELSFIDRPTSNLFDNERFKAEVDRYSQSDDIAERSMAHVIRWNVEDQQACVNENERLDRERQLAPPDQPIEQPPKRPFDITTAIYQYVPGDHRFKLNNDPTRRTIHVRMSCNQKDLDICNRIYQQLTQADYYEMSLGVSSASHFSEETMVAEVERADVVLVCLSNDYRSSHACRIEATYAAKRQRTIIGVKVNTNYFAAKWLDNMLVGQTTVNFVGTNFSTACKQLMDTIDREAQDST